MVLATAEVLAVPFYQALRDATCSSLLRSICSGILRDEAAHLKFQALTLGVIRRPISQQGRAFRSLCHAVLFKGTAYSCGSSIVACSGRRVRTSPLLE
jgi:hypothetical protein